MSNLDQEQIVEVFKVAYLERNGWRLVSASSPTFCKEGCSCEDNAYVFGSAEPVPLLRQTFSLQEAWYRQHELDKESKKKPRPRNKASNRVGKKP